MTRVTNLARFDLVSIRLAIYCAESGTLTGGAKRANMSLSRASYRLAALENSVGKRLFQRHYHGLQRTEAGTILVCHGRALLRTVDELGSLLAQSNSGAGRSGYADALQKNGSTGLY
jgi:DNA-binding transcriptional LysR family regulator